MFSRVGILRDPDGSGHYFYVSAAEGALQLVAYQSKRTSPHHPQTNELVERFNKTLKSMLRRLVSKDWDRLLPYVLLAYRKVPQSTTGFSPFELLYGREVRGPLDVLREEREASTKSDESVSSHILLVRERSEKMSELVSEHVKGAHKCQKLWYDQNARESVGVWRRGVSIVAHY